MNPLVKDGDCWVNTANQVADKIAELKRSLTAKEITLSEAIFETAKACKEWAYVYGSWGAYCTTSERKKRQGYHPEKTEITKKCQVLNGSKSSCTGCKWYPNGEKTRVYDCRGFTDWCLNQFNDFGVVNLHGDSVGVQWKTKKNWKAQGTIDTIPDDILVCLFVYKNGNWQHTGLGYKGASCECGVGVEYYDVRKAKWTHWAIPVGIEGGYTPVPDKKPTLRVGDSGTYVSLLQTMLIQRGYPLPKYGADGKYGNETFNAVKAFQSDSGLVSDGICGAKTWGALESIEPTKHYTVSITGLTFTKAEALLAEYPWAVMTEEGR